MKDLFLDLETTGLDPKEHSIVEISCFVEIEGWIKEVFTIFVKPDPKEKLDQRVLRLLDKTPTELQERGMTPVDAKKKLESKLSKYINKYNKLDKFFFLAYNSPFDNQFLRAFWTKADDQYFGSWFHTPDICIMRLAMDHLKKERKVMPNFRQETVAKHLGIKVEESLLHGAYYDVSLANRIYHIIRKEEQPELPNTQ